MASGCGIEVSYSYAGIGNTVSSTGADSVQSSEQRTTIGGMEYMTVTEAAQELGITDRAVRARIKRGDIRAERVGPRLWLIPKDEIEAWRDLGKARPWELRQIREAEPEPESDTPAGEA